MEISDSLTLKKKNIINCEARFEACGSDLLVFVIDDKKLPFEAENHPVFMIPRIIFTRTI